MDHRRTGQPDTPEERPTSSRNRLLRLLIVVPLALLAGIEAFHG